MIKPTIHLNGTAAESLLDQYVAAGQAIRKALDTLAEAEPNARDYYVQPQGAFLTAQSEHRQRINCLRGVLSDMEILAEHCANGGVS